MIPADPAIPAQGPGQGRNRAGAAWRPPDACAAPRARAGRGARGKAGRA